MRSISDFGVKTGLFSRASVCRNRGVRAIRAALPSGLPFCTVATLLLASCGSRIDAGGNDPWDGDIPLDATDGWSDASVEDGSTGGRVLVGDDRSGYAARSADPGLPEVFPFVASSSGLAQRLYLQLAPDNLATTVEVGLYASTDWEDPGQLLTAGNLSVTGPGWNSVSVAPARVDEGELYFIAVLSLTPHTPVIYNMDQLADPVRSSSPEHGGVAKLPDFYWSGPWEDAFPLCAYGATF